MRIMFVYWAFEDQGSGLLINGYTRAARAMGHDVVVYGAPIPNIPLHYSLDVEGADALVYIFEWTTSLLNGDNLDFARLSKIPRRRTVILDGDGNYNDLVAADGDYNHRDDAARRQWMAICDGLSDKVCQPTLHPLRPNVTPFLFYCYDPAWEQPLNLHGKDFGLLYVGNSKFRWGAMARVLQAVEPLRPRLGRVGIVGHGWEAPPPWAQSMDMEAAYFTDVAYLRRLGVELLPPVPFTEVVGMMGRALVSPVLTRPTFDRLKFVTPRYFETPAAGTIPLFLVDPDHVRDIYGEPALDLVLPADNPAGKIADVLDEPDRYAAILEQTRRHLTSHHTHAARLRQLIDIIEQ